MLFDNRTYYFITFSPSLVNKLQDNNFHYLFKDSLKGIEYFAFEETKELKKFVSKHSTGKRIDLGGFEI